MPIWIQFGLQTKSIAHPCSRISAFVLLANTKFYFGLLAHIELNDLVCETIAEYKLVLSTTAFLKYKYVL